MEIPLIMKKVLILILTLVVVACSDKGKDARLMLEDAKKLSEQGQFDDAEHMIDSIRKTYPRAVEQIREGVTLKKEVRIAKNNRQIAICDSLIPLAEANVNALKKQFVFNQNKEYQTKGFYFPKKTPTTILSTYFRSSVTEEGEVYLESVFVGGGKHSKVQLSSNGEVVESLPIVGDGVNYRFVTLGKQYEVLTITPANQNGMLNFVVKNQKNPIKITLKGSGATSYNLSNLQKTDIVLSSQLADAIQERDSLMSVKDKATILLNYVKDQQASTKDSE